MKSFLILGCMMLILLYSFNGNLTTEPINIHVIPHSHDDAGWIWTFEDYYYRTGGSWASVKAILDNMVLSLFDKTDRTFIYVEMAFFTKWYKDLTEDVKMRVKQLLREERFEFINGGYVMHDEATTYYQHFIDQMRLGLLFLKEEFEYIPKIAWFIDPFGHSAANAYILQEMGFEKIVFVRIDYKEKEIRRANKTLEFFYIPFGKINPKAKIFTHVTYNHYCNPEGMDNFLTDMELNLTPQDLSIRAEKTYQDLKKISSGYRGENVLMMYGCDFSHNARDNNFINLEKLMATINKNYPDMKLNYSTPSKYFEVIFQKVKDWPEYSNQDFFPYADFPYAYWTGYYSSRPYLKGLVREAGNYLLMSSRMMFELILLKLNKEISDKPYENLMKSEFFLREKLAICQHHDAVAGTAKEYTSQDYIHMLNMSIDKVKSSVEDIFSDLYLNQVVKICVANPTVNIECQGLIMPDSEDQHQQVLYLLNPGLDKAYPISFDYINSNINLYSEEGDEIPASIVCLDMNDSKYKCKVNFQFKFEKSNLFYKIILEKTTKNKEIIKSTFTNFEENILNTSIKFNIDELILTLKNDDNQIYNFSVKHGYFNAYDGWNSDLRPRGVNPAGAYVLSTVEDSPNIYKVDKNKSCIYKSENFLQVVIRFENSYLTIKYLNNFIFEIETIWDKITDDERSKGGKEYLLILSSDIKNNVNIPYYDSKPEIWTDSNGLKLMRRVKDYRAGYKYEVTEKIASNFYPVNYIASMRDRNDYQYDMDDYKGINYNSRILSIFNDRSQSMGALKEGEIIVILNRHSLKDDWKGLEEPLFEKNSASANFRYRHLIALSNKFDQGFVRNYINNKPFFFFQQKNKNLIMNKFRTLIQIKKGTGSIINKIIQHTSNIDVNFHVVKTDMIFVQIGNLSDPYLNSESKESFSFLSSEGLNYSIEEYNFAGTQKIKLKKNTFFKNNQNSDPILKDASYSIHPQEFRLFIIKLFFN